MAELVAAVATAIFRSLDSNDDGALSSAELSGGLADFGLDDEQLQALFLRLDTDQDGEISLPEFIAGYSSLPELGAVQPAVQPGAGDVDMDGFIECALACDMLFSQRLFTFLVLEGASFGIPPMRLIRGSVLADLGRFPRSDETEHVIIVDVRQYAALEKPLPHFISHRWASPDSPDTDDNAQAAALTAYLDKSLPGWHDEFFWLDYACIDQDDAQLKRRQVQALPLYMRCSNSFIGLAWGCYFERAWCRLELKGFRRDLPRQMVLPTGEELLIDHADLDKHVGGAPEDGQCMEGDRDLIRHVMQALQLVDDGFSRSSDVPSEVPKVESEELAALLQAARTGDVAAIETALPQLPTSGDVTADSCPTNRSAGWNGEGSNSLQWAAYSGHADAVSLLLEHVNKPSLRNGAGLTAWQHASHAHQSPAYPLAAGSELEDIISNKLRCVEVFEARARGGDERLRDELQARDEKQAKVDGLLKHQWRVCRW